MVLVLLELQDLQLLQNLDNLVTNKAYSFVHSEEWIAAVGNLDNFHKLLVIEFVAIIMCTSIAEPIVEPIAELMASITTVTVTATADSTFAELTKVGNIMVIATDMEMELVPTFAVLLA